MRSSTDLAPTTRATRALTDEPIVEGRAIRGTVIGLLFAAVIWLLIAMVFIALT